MNTNASTATSDPSVTPASEPSPLKQFVWAMQRLAQMQGSSIDMLSLNASASALEQPLPPIQTLPLMCQRMGLSKPKLVRQPDRVHLPMLCHTPDLGWGVVVDRNPLGLWVVMTPKGPQSVEEASHLRGSPINGEVISIPGLEESWLAFP